MLSDRYIEFDKVENSSCRLPRCEQPRTGFVAGFIGENNKLIGVVSRQRHGECQAEIDGGVTIIARCDPAHEWREGKEVTISIRPENVCVGPQADAPDIVISACVSEVIYLGDHVRLHLILSGGGVLVAKRPNRRTWNIAAARRCASAGARPTVSSGRPTREPPGKARAGTSQILTR
ncbi:TOBE domain-containing protein [Mesorhizobium huakuii]|uniref:TOBE domain-containing protein n=1 Tax=Mesorhizobium huakuii TaxID=28104 RepID=A0A7G6T5R4_9HYPH|nr:TOBE domain-containing protein [Mesorhizobium huakuii]QND62096.1 TOBE domain-containing protein [Mesorhizobium huakuii]